VGRDLEGKTEVLGEKLVPVPLCPPQIPHRRAMQLIQVSRHSSDNTGYVAPVNGSVSQTV
jgi:hypothetical protein